MSPAVPGSTPTSLVGFINTSLYLDVSKGYVHLLHASSERCRLSELRKLLEAYMSSRGHASYHSAFLGTKQASG
jgi:hypothetical protein